MAHAAKYTKAVAGHMTKHYDRTAANISNEKIDPRLTHENYNLAPHRDGSQMDFINQRCSEVKCLNRKDVNVMCSWAVTMPQTLHPYEHERFFKTAYDFLADRYGGEKNVISAHVHMDETTPHMHFAFVPVVTDKKKGIEKVAAKEAIDRKDLQTFHFDLDKRMTQEFGRDIGVINEATKDGNKTVAELKRETAIEQQVELTDRNFELQGAIENKIAEINDLEAKYGDKKKSLDLTHEKHAKALQGKIDALQGQYNGLELTAKHINSIQPEKGIVPGTIKNVGIQDIENLKKTAIAGVNAHEQVRELEDRNGRLHNALRSAESKIPNMAERMEQAKNKDRLDKLEQAFKKLPPEQREQLIPTKAIAKSFDRGR